MNKCIRKLLILTLLSCFVLSFIGCTSTPPPDNAVKDFFESVKKNDIKTASAYLSTGDSAFKYDSKEQEEIVGLIFEKVEYEIVSTTTNKDSAVVKAKIKAPDLVKITGEVVKELLSEIFSAALSDDESSEDKVEEMTIDAFRKNLSKPDLSYASNDIDINLTLDKGTNKWIIESGDTLVNAITGNAAEAFNELNESEKSSSEGQPTETSQNENVPDSNTYKLNQEAIYGRIAVTVENVVKSQGNEIDKPEEGMEYVIVTLKIRNAADSNDFVLKYNPLYFQMQNSKGQISTLALTTVNSDTMLNAGKLDTNGEVTGTIAFEGPVNDNQLYLVFVPESEALLKFDLNSK